jgi:putative ABC transport system ATP-binding protein
MSDTIISARELRKTYHVGDVDVHALRGVDLDVRRGEFLAIVGHSGSGKSTLFNIIGGLTPPTAGHIMIDGKDLRQMSESDRTDLRKQSIGFVFQKYNLLPTLTAHDNIALARSMVGKSLDVDQDQQFQEVLTLLGIAHRLHHKPRALSGGEQQRVAIARAVVAGPALLLADEPTGNLDRATGEAVIDYLFDEHARLGSALLLITHDAALAERCERRLDLADGSIVGERRSDRDAATRPIRHARR